MGQQRSPTAPPGAWEGTGRPASAGLTEEEKRTADRHLWLLSPVAPIPPRPPAHRDLEVACWLLRECWQALPAAWPRLLAWIGPRQRKEACVRLVEARAEGIRYAARVQVMLWKQIAAAFEARGIPYVLLKSSLLRWIVYDSPLDRSGLDLDFGVPRAHLGACQEVLRGLGFAEAQLHEATGQFQRANPLLRALVESYHYELGFLVRRQRIHGLTTAEEQAIRLQLQEQPNAWQQSPDGTLICNVTVDVHHGISREIAVDALVADRQPIRAGTEVYYGPPLAWVMLHLLFKLYWEGVNNYGLGLYQFADLCRLAGRLEADDVDALRGLLAEWRMEAAAYYCFRRLPTDFATPLPAHLARMVEAYARPDPDKKPVAENDLGDMWPKLWGRR